MEGSRNSNSTYPKASSIKKILGTNTPPKPTIEIATMDDEGPSIFLGGIVEKGFSDKPFVPTPLPKPTVIPFPVARHRSHGPHWSPIGSKKSSNYSHSKNDDADGKEDGETEKDLARFAEMSDFANQVHRKEKKDLDMGRWRELLLSNTSKVAKIDEEGKVAPSIKIVDEKKTVHGLLSDPNEGMSMEIIERRQVNYHEDLTNASVGFTTAPAVSSYSSDKCEDKQPSMSLESQIDSENLARLQGMSPDEIAEARAEIMDKIDPTLLKRLKKRGQDKLKKGNSLTPNVASNGEPGTLRSRNKLDQDKIHPTQSGSDIPQDITEISRNSHNGKYQGVQQNLGSNSNSSWNVWRDRVEAVRRLRFSLDGIVVGNDNVQGPDTCPIPNTGRHSADVTERDFLLTEGDPGAAGYTIKEAATLTRSVIPGQRGIGLHLLSSVLNKALQNIWPYQVGCTMRSLRSNDMAIDWEAVWAFALGPEPELILCLRMCLDDNHASVVLACARVIHSALSCDFNENFFDISEKAATYDKDIYTAPVFRRKSQMDVGFLHGGFWKYSAKPSNIFPFQEDHDEETEERNTIQDDIVVAGQDFAAGLVRMGVLPRIRYLLETDPITALEDCLTSILAALARHSPSSASAIMNCPRLVQTVVHRFTMKDVMEVHYSTINSVILLKVLARSDKQNCIEFIQNGVFRDMTLHLYQYSLSLNHWIQSGRDCKLSSALMVEQLRLWKVCLQYGYCVSYFPEIFPALCLWLNPPTFEILVENNILSEFASISREAYLVLEALARNLPNFFSQRNLGNQMPKGDGEDMEIWSWSYVSPMVDLAVKWLVLKTNPCMSMTPVLWVISAVMHMLSTVFRRIAPKDTIDTHGSNGQVPWLPEFVPKVGLEIIKNGFMSFSATNGTEYGRDISRCGSFIEEMCQMRKLNEPETALAAMCCLHGLTQVIVNIDSLIHLARIGNPSHSRECSMSTEGEILKHGILKESLAEWQAVLYHFMKLIASEWHYVQSIETFGRGGPAPGVGLGWGASGDGFWSPFILLVQTDASLLVQLLEMFPVVCSPDFLSVEETTFTMQRINSALGICLTAGPRERVIAEKALDMLIQVPVLKYLGHCIRCSMHFNGENRLIGFEENEDIYQHFSKILASHYKSRWLSVKKKRKAIQKELSGNIKVKKGNTSLATILEDVDASVMISRDNCGTSWGIEWSHQRLPLPLHWFLSPISTICNSKRAGHLKPSNLLDIMMEPNEFLEVAKSGLFFLLGIESMSSFLPAEVSSPIKSVPLVWKIHSLSVSLLPGLCVLEDKASRNIYEALQELYGRLLDEARLNRNPNTVLEKEICLFPEPGNEYRTEFLRFQSDIHEIYSTFLENLVEQFAAISYGDLAFGRQVAIYLHRCVEAPIRLAAWNALSNARVLELLPHPEKCFGDTEGYLEPIEENEDILEAYVKSWVSGAVDRAVTRESIAYTLVLHHVSSFIFLTADKLSLRNKLVKAILRDYVRKPQHEKMMMDFIHYSKLMRSQTPDGVEGSSLQGVDIGKRLDVLIEACEKDASLLKEVEKLKSLLGGSAQIRMEPGI